ncbi:LOW QUALITY PROTEIN: dnaJ homolog subfamily C member 17-like, partial [Dioscorea cayenensis subsp. rotundata]|uniref:LOW QUALITY PROTEIN: dnaJ homolog subfamily C member 17-like n=1 Tax=Dioscorea cayennensis subsp. rotundata TaxID=55577 RepID=A0AB40CUY7_DIOCR
CLPSVRKGSKLSLKQIDKAYRDQSRSATPTKRPNDPDATADFQRLTTSYEILRDVSSRAVFDAHLRSIREKAFRASLFDGKRRKLASDLEERERAAAAPQFDPAELAARKEKMVAAELQQELASIPVPQRRRKSLWERDGRDYDSVQLTKLFERFGMVEDVVIRSRGSKKKGSAIVVMSSKDAAVAATQTMSGDISNPLLVVPLRASSSASNARHAEPVVPKHDDIIGAGFRDYEESILKKLEKAKEKDGAT